MFLSFNKKKEKFEIKKKTWHKSSINWFTSLFHFEHYQRFNKHIRTFSLCLFHICPIFFFFFMQLMKYASSTIKFSIVLLWLWNIWLVFISYLPYFSLFHAIDEICLICDWIFNCAFMVVIQNQCFLISNFDRNLFALL